MEKEFLILDGATGELKRKFTLPDPYAHDCIIIANLRGRERPSHICFPPIELKTGMRREPGMTAKSCRVLRGVSSWCFI